MRGIGGRRPCCLAVVLCVLSTVRASSSTSMLRALATSSTTGSLASASAGHSCAATMETWNASAAQCGCKSGLSGMDCGVCSTSSVCQQYYGDAKTTYACKSGLEYRKSTITKTYQCQLDAALQALIKNGEFAIVCDRAHANCTGALYLANETWRGEHVIHCDLTKCSFTDGSTDVKCGLAMCKCGSFCTASTKTLVESSLSNQPAKITVKNGTSVSIEVEGAPLPLSAICTASTCEVESQSTGSSSGSGSVTEVKATREENIMKIEIAICVMVCVFILLCMCCGQYCVKTRGDGPTGIPKAVVDRAIQASTARSTRKLTFKRINCQVTVTKGKTKEVKRILQDISGSARRGQVLGLMGPSGSGKTSLLNTLAAVANGQCVCTGDIKIDGRKIAKDYRRIAAYVQQDDALFATLTVRECLQYSAELRLPTSMSSDIKYEIVSRVIAELNLGKVEHSRIGGVSGSSARGISGGERRRVSIGMELVTFPQVIFLDEPTSGLDSYSANSVVQLVKDLANHGRIVVLSIHQPSTKSFMLLDQVMLLAQGKLLYHGSPQEVQAHFDGAGFKCPESDNVADYILEVASDTENIPVLQAAMKTGTSPARTPLLTGAADGAPITPIPLISDEHQLEMPLLRDDINQPPPRLNHVDSSRSDFDPAPLPQLPKQSKLTEMRVLFLRTAQNTFRHRSLLMLHIALSIVLGLFVGIIFHHVTNDLAGFQNRSGAFFFVLTFFGFASLSSMDLFIAERTIFLRETGAMYYGAFSYFISKALLDTLFLRVIPAFIFASIFYWIMGLQETAEHFIMFLVAIILFNIAAGSISILIGVISPSVGIANLAATVVYLIMLLFGGFLLNVKSMSGGIKWLKSCSIFSYAFEAMMGNELKGLLLKFDAPGYPSVPVYGDVFLKTLDMYYENRYKDMVALAIFSCVLQFIAFVVLYFQVPVRQQLVDDVDDDVKGLRHRLADTDADSR